MLIIGLTGSIASGKTTIAKALRRRHIPIFDADKYVHELLGPHGRAVPEILSHFGDVGSWQEGIDRQALSKVIFAAPEKRAALEGITHPMVAEGRAGFISLMRANYKKAVCLDVPLLFENNIDIYCDLTIVSAAPFAMRQQRALARPGMTKEKFDQIIAAQMPQSEKIARADIVISTALGHNHMTKQLYRLLSSLGLKTDYSQKAHYV